MHEEPAVQEKCQVRKEKAHETAQEKEQKEGTNVERVSRGKRLVELSKQRKRKNDDEVEPRSKVPKPTKGEDHTKLTVPRTTQTHNFKELDRDLLTIDETNKIGSGTFGRCFTATYRNQYRVIVKEMKVRDSSKKESDRAKQEVIHEASVLADLGDHPEFPIYLECVLYMRPFIWFWKSSRLRVAVLPSRRLWQQA